MVKDCLKPVEIYIYIYIEREREREREREVNGRKRKISQFTKKKNICQNLKKTLVL